MNKIKDSHNKMWNFLEKLIYDAAESKYNAYLPELRLISAIVIQSAKDRDFDYFNSNIYRYHATMLKVNHMFLIKQMQHAWALEDNKSPWIEPDLEEVL